MDGTTLRRVSLYVLQLPKLGIFPDTIFTHAMNLSNPKPTTDHRPDWDYGTADYWIHLGRNNLSDLQQPYECLPDVWALSSIGLEYTRCWPAGKLCLVL